MSRKYDVEFNLMISIAHKESDGKFDNNGKVSITSDYGVYQINEINHEAIEEHFGYTTEDLKNNPKKNIEAAAWLIQKICNMYEKDNLEDIFGTYNGWIDWRLNELSPEYVKECLQLYNNVYNKNIEELFLKTENKRKI